jgi:hypothetical protein
MQVADYGGRLPPLPWLFLECRLQCQSAKKQNFLDDLSIRIRPFDYIAKGEQPARPKTVTG